MIYKKLGFTLAEVLITLLIIGIVASLTIPAIIQDTQNAELKIAFKKSFAEISQAAELLRRDNGGTLLGVFKDDDEDNAMLTIKPYFSLIKYCPTYDVDCWPVASGYSGRTLVLKNGALITTTGSDWVNSYCTNQFNNNCLGLTVDVNGFKGPGKDGKDIFYIGLLANRTIPVGSTGDAYANDCGSGTNNIGCAGWIMLNKDYK